jgi:uncharacterized protein (DUF58 family)
MDDVTDLIRRIEKIEITTKNLAEGLPAGMRSSLFRAQGMEFTSLREYIAGDDIRAIDWKVSARKNHPYVREFTEDREGIFYFVVDRSGSSGFGSDAGKDEKMLEVVASLMFAAGKNHERVGLCLFTDRVECFVRARAGRPHLIHLLSVLIRHRPHGTGTDIGSAIRFLSETLTRRSSIVILSDFLGTLPEPTLRILRSHNEVIAIRISDIREQELPDVGLVAIEDMESGEQVLLDTSDGRIRARYQKLAREEDERLLYGLRKCNARTITLMSGDSPYIPLRRFFSSRQQRRSG